MKNPYPELFSPSPTSTQFRTSVHHPPFSLNDPHTLEEDMIMQALSQQIGAMMCITVLALPQLHFTFP